MDAVVIGGGFYGCVIAIFLASRRHFRVLLVERENGLMRRASRNNQARVHNGCHYPRSLVTAYRSQVNLPRFIRDWPDAVRTDFTKLYAITRRNSMVTAGQFRNFCHRIGASLEPAQPDHRALFNSRLVEDVFLVLEYVFDYTKLAAWATERLAECRTGVRLATRALGVTSRGRSGLGVQLATDSGGCHEVATRYVFNCTYSALNQLGGEFPGTVAGLRHEITEIALVRVPPILENLGITVMDGPFFSVLPFPARGLHTLSHVRYTPHMHWLDQRDIDPHERLARYCKISRIDRMRRDAERYLPAMAGACHVDSLFEIKTTLAKNETDDGRPILFERHDNLPGCYSVLGSKIDNIHDMIERIDDEIP